MLFPQRAILSLRRIQVQLSKCFFPRCHIHISSSVDLDISLFSKYPLRDSCVPGTASDADSTGNKIDTLCKKKKKKKHTGIIVVFVYKGS